jgi:23S rRNA pseudouridine2605 synthase
MPGWRLRAKLFTSKPCAESVAIGDAMRLNRFLAAAGIGSRRQCDQLIATGRVTINGERCTDFSTQPEVRDHVKVDGKLVPRKLSGLHIILHKPAGFVSTRSDPHARNIIFDLLPAKFPRLFNVGRLDAQTEGLLLLTNDGDLAQRLTHPRYEIEKEYEVILDRPWDSALTPKLMRGIFLDGKNAEIARLHSMTPTRLRVVLRQGINRQIRRTFETVGYRVKHLVRTRMGNLCLGDLPCGHWRALTKFEVASLKRPRKTGVSPVMEDGRPACRRAGAAVSHDRRKRLSSATSLRRAR